MYLNAHDEGSGLLRLEFHVAKALHQNGFLAVLRVVIIAWWNRPHIPSDLPARLRADMGLPLETESMFWRKTDDCWLFPIAMLRP